MNRRRRLARVLLVAAAPVIVVAAAAAASGGPGPLPMTVEITMRYSHFEPSGVQVPVGVPVTFVLHNADPIDHEWIVGDAAVQQRHRVGTEPLHGDRPTEVSVDAGTVRTTTVTFSEPGRLLYICHLPGHEAYGMVGVVTIVDRGS
jgi:uncharacterized cupredoxin-like copper-binding protein